MPNLVVTLQPTGTPLTRADKVGLQSPISTYPCTTVQEAIEQIEVDVRAAKVEIADFTAYDFVVWLENQLL